MQNDVLPEDVENEELLKNDNTKGKIFLENCRKIVTPENACIFVGSVLGGFVAPEVSDIAQQFDPVSLPPLATSAKLLLAFIGGAIGGVGGAFVADKIVPK